MFIVSVSLIIVIDFGICSVKIIHVLISCGCNEIKLISVVLSS